MSDEAKQTDIVDLLCGIDINSSAEITEPNGWSYYTNIGVTVWKAAATITQLRADLAAAVEALRPFAVLEDCLIEIRHFRNVCELLARLDKGGEK